MPELPEVQTIVSDLNKKIQGDVITDFWSDFSGAIKDSTLDKFKKEIKNRKIVKVHRVGKNIFIELSGGKTMHVHLRMTGHLLVKRETQNVKRSLHASRSTFHEKDYFAEKVNQYIHHIFYLKTWNVNRETQNGMLRVPRSTLYDKTIEFSDLRRFATIRLINTKDFDKYLKEKKIGVDAMSAEFTFLKFREILKERPKAVIGILLLEQSLIAGIGNIYRSEILYDAGVLPERKVGSLSETEIKKIYKSTKKILERAIKLRGTSDSDYRDTSGAPGAFQKALQVYKRTGKKCRKCDTIIKRKALAQRSVFFCEKCQQ